MNTCLSIVHVIWISILLLGNALTGRAQLDATVFREFSQTMLNPYLINPSATDTSYLFKIRANNLDELGLIRNVSRFYIDADKRVPTSRRNAFHFVGLQAINSKIGEYIYKSRLQARYSWYVQLSKRACISSGVSLGFINYAFLTTQGGTGGSAFGPDGAIGLHYIRSRTVVGFAIQQLFTPVLIPVDQSFRLGRIYTADISHRFTLSPRINLTTSGAVQYSGQGPFLYTIGAMADISDVVLVGINTFALSKTSVNVGVQHIRIFSAEWTMVTTYSFYHGTFPLPNSTLELFMALQI